MAQWKSPSNYDGIVGRKNALHLIQLRWIAVLGQISTIAIVNLVLHIAIPTPSMLAILIFLIAFNIASSLRWHESVTVSSGELFIALLVDVISLTAQLYLSGGTQNPFAFLYLLQVIISAVHHCHQQRLPGRPVHILGAAAIASPCERHVRPVCAGHGHLLCVECGPSDDLHYPHQPQSARR